jgi:putative DNA primase/helicase
MSQRIESALSFIPADERETWVAMGMAVKSELGEYGFEIWDTWSRTAENYNHQSAKSVWRSCRGTGVTVGTLFHAAKGFGWVDSEKPVKPSFEQLQARRREMQERTTLEGMEREKEQHNAAKKAAWIMHQTILETHAYLDSKGWRELKGAVWRPTEENNLLCIPMRVGDSLVGLQMIDRNGVKKFLKGQRTSEAEYMISNLGRGCFEWYCEGYATGLSLREALHALRMRYRIHVTFSASNLVKVAAKYGAGFVIADNDASGTGERVAKQTGLPYFMPETGDFNDFAKAAGIFTASQAIRKFILNSAQS